MDGIVDENALNQETVQGAALLEYRKMTLFGFCGNMSPS